MKRFTELAKEGKIGRVCKRGAWIIAALGTLGLFLQIYSAWEMYHQLHLAQPESPYSDLSFFLSNASYAFGTAVSTIFFFLVLYVAGAIIDSFFLPEESDITLEPLEEEEVASRRVKEKKKFFGGHHKGCALCTPIPDELYCSYALSDWGSLVNRDGG